MAGAAGGRRGRLQRVFGARVLFGGAREADRHSPRSAVREARASATHVRASAPALRSQLTSTCGSCSAAAVPLRHCCFGQRLCVCVLCASADSCVCVSAAHRLRNPHHRRRRCTCIYDNNNITYTWSGVGGVSFESEAAKFCNTWTDKTTLVVSSYRTLVIAS
ncbi:hypothetical protein BaRGS_00032858 [Batillaria attramentaria]|uniref:Uncharacterized protein n=1 Tax=Batillaria attramentaria TaxID=370345 RepID=A0ABD0JMC3_9CAEN